MNQIFFVLVIQPQLILQYPFTETSCSQVQDYHIPQNPPRSTHITILLNNPQLYEQDNYEQKSLQIYFVKKPGTVRKLSFQPLQKARSTIFRVHHQKRIGPPYLYNFEQSDGDDNEWQHLKYCQLGKYRYKVKRVVECKPREVILLEVLCQSWLLNSQRKIALF